MIGAAKRGNSANVAPCRVGVCVTLAAIGLSTSFAAAQEGSGALIQSALGTQNPGALGFKIGDENRGRLHPFIDVEGHWITNPGRLNPVGPSDLMTAARIGYDLRFPSTVFDITSDAGLAYNKYWGLQVPSTSNFTNISGHFNFHGVVNPESSLQLRIDESLVRSADPGNQTINRRLLHWMEQAALGVDARPGNGALLLSFGAGYFYDYYDRNQLNIENGILNNSRFLPELRLSWKFLPKTAIFVEGRSQITFYAAAQYSDGVRNINSAVTTAQMGLAGSLTHRVTVLAKAGYGNTFLLSGPDNLQTAVGELQINFQPAETAQIIFAAVRTVQPAAFFRWFEMNRFYIRYDQQFSAYTILSVMPQFVTYDFGVPLEPPLVNRHDNQFMVSFTLSQKIIDWLTLAIVDNLDYRLSNYTTAVGNAGYVYNDVQLKIDFRY